MAATPVMSMLAARAALDAILAKLNTGGAGTIEIRTGAPEATTLTADSGTKLATLTFSATAFPASADGTSNGLATGTASAITSDTNAANSGTAGHFRAKSGAGTVILQGTVGTSAADMILNTTTITAGDTVACTSYVVTLPDGTGSD